MVDFEAPSFSLGLDLELDSEPQRTVTGKLCLSKPAPQPPTSSSALPTFQLLHEDDDDDFESPPTLFNPPLKRPRRGPTSKPALFGQKPGAVNLGRKCNVDGEEEFVEFSSLEEDRRSRDEHPSTQYYSGCSSSKFPLPQHGIFIAQSARKMKQVSNAPASSNMETSSNKRTCPNLTASPLGRFHLIDSDSDDPSVSEGTNRGTDKANPLLSSSEQGKRKESGKTTRTEHLWDDFCVEERLKIPTPALDEFCEEYFKSMQNKYEGQSNTEECYQSRNMSKSYGQQLNLGDPLPPSHRYFFHVDPRIQNLIHSRLPNFFPLGAVNSSGYAQPSTPVIDYMCQFSHGDGSKQAAGKNNSATSSGRNRRSSKKSSSEEVSEGSGGWVNPKDCAVTPKNAVKRRANAAGQSAGHWYTASNGKRVYVSKKGQELTGRIAYRNYKKEGGAGSNRSKKNGKAEAGPKRAKKKSGAGSKKSKKKSAAKKK